MRCCFPDSGLAQLRIAPVAPRPPSAQSTNGIQRARTLCIIASVRWIGTQEVLLNDALDEKPQYPQSQNEDISRAVGSKCDAKEAEEQTCIDRMAKPCLCGTS